MSKPSEKGHYPVIVMYDGDWGYTDDSYNMEIGYWNGKEWLAGDQIGKRHYAGHKVVDWLDVRIPEPDPETNRFP